MKSLGLLFGFLTVALSAPAQSMPTQSVLTRTRMVQSEDGQYRATIFSIDVDGREYWITAKHFLSGAAHPPYGLITQKRVSVSVLDTLAHDEKWDSVSFAVIDPGKDIDIVVLAAKTPLLSHPFASPPTDSHGATMGGECEFLGFPYGGGWRTEVDGTSYWLPFVKHCTLSNLGVGNRGESRDARIVVGDKKVWVLDGINNHGFSGGPVIINAFGEQRIMAVVSGYVTDPEDVIDSSKTRRRPTSQTAPSRPRQRVDANSGFIVAFDIIYAIEAINKNPIGPLRAN